MMFNESTKEATKVLNYEKEVAYSLSPELELYTLAVTSVLGGKFYESTEDRIERLRSLISKCSSLFVAKLAVYTRNNMYLRSIPLVLLVELARIHNNDNLISKTIPKVVKRVDEITELLAYYQIANNRKDTKKLNKLSKQIQKGLAATFNNFDEYQFAKYNRAAEIQLRDALFLVHPKPHTQKQQEIFNRITTATLKTPYTWEVEISNIGQTNHVTEEDKIKAFKNKWEELIDSGKLGYMATLRNLRNMLEASVSMEHILKVASYISTREVVLKSKQLPFRFLSAYREISEIVSGRTSALLEALEDAIQVSAENIKGYDYNIQVAIACDVSGSMQRSVSRRSTVQNYDIGLVLGMLLRNKCKNVITGMFGNTWKVINVPSSNILTNADMFHRREGEVGYSTNGYLVIRDLKERQVVLDKVCIFTDCQMWDSYYDSKNHIKHEWNEYKQMAPNAKLYLFDLAGYGNTPLSVHQGGVHLIAGWSDKIFDILEAIENGSNAVAEIEKIKL